MIACSGVDVSTFYCGDGVRAEAGAAPSADSPFTRLLAAQVVEEESTRGAGGV